MSGTKVTIKKDCSFCSAHLWSPLRNARTVLFSAGRGKNTAGGDPGPPTEAKRFRPKKGFSGEEIGTMRGGKMSTIPPVPPPPPPQPPVQPVAPSSPAPKRASTSPQAKPWIIGVIALILALCCICIGLAFAATRFLATPAQQPAPALQPAAPVVQPTAPAVTDPTPKNAVILHNGDTVIPNWGYGPWGVVGVDYVDVFPNQQANMGPVEFKTDFNGQNWVPSGCWTWQLPSAWREIRISVQGDTPVQVTVQKNELKACSNAQITMKAQASIDGTPKPSAGSSGFSIVAYIK